MLHRFHVTVLAQRANMTLVRRESYVDAIDSVEAIQEILAAYEDNAEFRGVPRVVSVRKFH